MAERGEGKRDTRARVCVCVRVLRRVGTGELGWMGWHWSMPERGLQRIGFVPARSRIKFLHPPLAALLAALLAGSAPRARSSRDWNVARLRIAAVPTRS